MYALLQTEWSFPRTYYPIGQLSYQSCHRSKIPLSDFFFTPNLITFKKKSLTVSRHSMSKSTGYPTCSRTHRLGRWSYSSPPPLPFFGSFQIGLRFHCLRVGFKVTPKSIGPDSSSRTPYSVGSFRHIPCSEFVPSLSSRRLKLSLFVCFIA